MADEVRNLAIRSADAAKTTTLLIEDTVTKVKDSSNVVSVTNDAFTSVVSETNKISRLIAEIAAASQEQSRGIDQINRAVLEIDKVTLQTASSAEESASASEEMNAQAEQMQSVVGDLAELIGGRNGRREKTRQPLRRRSGWIIIRHCRMEMPHLLRTTEPKTKKSLQRRFSPGG